VGDAHVAGQLVLQRPHLVPADVVPAVEDPFERRQQLGAERLVGGVQVDQRDGVRDGQ